MTDASAPRFYWNTKYNPPRPYVEVMIPGDRQMKPHFPVNDKHRERWPDQWRQFESTGRNVVEGLPIEKWSAISPEQAQELRVMNIFTVEQLALMADHLVGRIGPGARELQRKAQAWVAAGGDADRATETLLDQASRLSEQSQRVTDLESLTRDLQTKLAAARGAEGMAKWLAEQLAALRTEAGLAGDTLAEVLAEAREHAGPADLSDAEDPEGDGMSGVDLDDAKAQAAAEEAEREGREPPKKPGAAARKLPKKPGAAKS